MQQFSNAKVTNMSRIFEESHQGDPPFYLQTRLKVLKGHLSQGSSSALPEQMPAATESFLLLAAGCLTDTKNLRLGGCY